MRPRTSKKPASYRRVRIITALTQIERVKQGLLDAATEQTERTGNREMAIYDLNRAMVFDQVLKLLMAELSVERNELAL